MRLPPPGPSYVKEETVALRDGEKLSAGMTLPSVMDDGWWLTNIWVADGEGVVSALRAAPAGGPPPGAPLQSMGPRVAGALSGLIAEEGGRQLIRLRMPPAEDESRPWERHLVCMVAIKCIVLPNWFGTTQWKRGARIDFEVATTERPFQFTASSSDMGATDGMSSAPSSPRMRMTFTRVRRLKP